MTTCDTNTNKSDIMFQITALNKAVIKLNIEQLENEILSFEDFLHDVLNHPENARIDYIENIKEKFLKLDNLKRKLALLDK